MERITRNLNAAMLAALGLVIVALMFGLWRGWILTNYLQEHRAYIRERDARWEPFLQRLENHLTEQDKDMAEILKAIREHK